MFSGIVRGVLAMSSSSQKVVQTVSCVSLPNPGQVALQQVARRQLHQSQARLAMPLARQAIPLSRQAMPLTRQALQQVARRQLHQSQARKALPPLLFTLAKPLARWGRVMALSSLHSCKPRKH